MRQSDPRRSAAPDNMHYVNSLSPLESDTYEELSRDHRQSVHTIRRDRGQVEPELRTATPRGPGRGRGGGVGWAGVGHADPISVRFRAKKIRAENAGLRNRAHPENRVKRFCPSSHRFYNCRNRVCFQSFTLWKSTEPRFSSLEGPDSRGTFFPFPFRKYRSYIRAGRAEKQ